MLQWKEKENDPLSDESKVDYALRNVAVLVR